MLESFILFIYFICKEPINSNVHFDHQKILREHVDLIFLRMMRGKKAFSLAVMA